MESQSKKKSTFNFVNENCCLRNNSFERDFTWGKKMYLRLFFLQQNSDSHEHASHFQIVNVVFVRFERFQQCECPLFGSKKKLKKSEHSQNEWLLFYGIKVFSYSRTIERCLPFNWLYKLKWPNHTTETKRNEHFCVEFMRIERSVRAWSFASETE